MNLDEYKILAKKIANGDKEAEEVLVKLNKLCTLWDNIWDEDVKINKEDIDAGFTDLSFELSRNGFYRKYRDVLEAQIFVSWNAWQAANQWKRNPDKIKRAYAFFIKEYCFEIEHLIAWLIGGKDHATKLNLEIREQALTQLKNSKPYFMD